MRILSSRRFYEVSLFTCLLLGLATQAFATLNWKVVSPDLPIYYFGDALAIIWSPTTPGIKKVEMVSEKEPKLILSMYGNDGRGDPVITSGIFTYNFYKFSFLHSGEYRIKLYPANGDAPFFSQVFRLDDPIGKVIKAETQKFSIKKVVGVKKKYSPDADMHVMIQAMESTKISADPSKGFSVQVGITDPLQTHTGYLKKVNAVYDPNLKKWSADLKVPVDVRDYELKISLYCGDMSIKSYCAQKYGQSKPVEKSLKFKVLGKNNKKTKPFIKIISPNGKELITNTKYVPLTWRMSTKGSYHVQFYLMPSKDTPFNLYNPDPKVRGWGVSGLRFLDHNGSSEIKHTYQNLNIVPNGEYKIRAYLYNLDPDYNYNVSDAIASDESDKYFTINIQADSPAMERARLLAQDSVIQTELSNLLPIAMTYFKEHGSFEGFCASIPYNENTTAVLMLTETIPDCNAYRESFAVSLPLRGQSKSVCVDNIGSKVGAISAVDPNKAFCKF